MFLLVWYPLYTAGFGTFGTRSQHPQTCLRCALNIQTKAEHRLLDWFDLNYQHQRWPSWFQARSPRPTWFKQWLAERIRWVADVEGGALRADAPSLANAAAIAEAEEGREGKVEDHPEFLVPRSKALSV